MGKRQDMLEGSKKEKPKSSQYESMTPPVIKAPSIMTICPRLWDFDVSDCHVGTVDVFMPDVRVSEHVGEGTKKILDVPFPTPVITLPATR